MARLCDILYVFPGTLWPVKGGGAARAWSLIDYFQTLGWNVHLVAPSHFPSDDTEIRTRVAEFWPVPKPWLPDPSRSGWLRRALEEFAEWVSPRRGPLLQPYSFLEDRRDPGLERHAIGVAEIVQPQVVFTSYVWTARLFGELPAEMLKVLDTIDVQSQRARAAKQAGGSFDSNYCSPEEEAVELRLADVLVAIQHEEGEELRRLCPDRPVVVAQHSLAPACCPSSPTSSQDVLYVGNLYAPNVEGLKTFLEEVWPQVLAAVPGARLVVCGAVSEAFSNHRPDVHLHGVVPDLNPFYEQSALVVNPTPYGTGLKIKSCEALARGKALVATRAGFLGMAESAREAAIVVESIPDLATPVIELLNAPSCR
ncbi:MAG: glycosyltransferase family 4 protein, partial [Acidobacteriota bacterium]